MRCHRPALPGGERVVDSLSLSTLRNQPARSDGSLTTTSCAITNSTWTAAVDTEIPKSSERRMFSGRSYQPFPHFSGHTRVTTPENRNPPFPLFPALLYWADHETAPRGHHSEVFLGYCTLGHAKLVTQRTLSASASTGEGNMSQTVGNE